MIAYYNNNLCWHPQGDSIRTTSGYSFIWSLSGMLQCCFIDYSSEYGSAFMHMQPARAKTKVLKRRRTFIRNLGSLVHTKRRPFKYLVCQGRFRQN